METILEKSWPAAMIITSAALTITAWILAYRRNNQRLAKGLSTSRPRWQYAALMATTTAVAFAYTLAQPLTPERHWLFLLSVYLFFAILVIPSMARENPFDLRFLVLAFLLFTGAQSLTYEIVDFERTEQLRLGAYFYAGMICDLLVITCYSKGCLEEEPITNRHGTIKDDHR